VSTLARRTDVRRLAMAICEVGIVAMRKNADIVEMARKFNKYFKLDNFRPYTYQERWFESGQHSTLRYLSAANQIGKTFGGAVECAYHATGLYPEWWNGRRFKVTNKQVIWVMGVSLESTRKVLQNYLLGTDDATQTSELGSGLIPREHLDLSSLVRDGQTVKSINVRNEAGGYVSLYFYASTQDETTLHGQKVLFIWLDEQPSNELELSSIFAARTINTGGMVAITATPEKGATELWRQCKEDNSPHIHFQSATWDDAEHITPDVRERILAAIPYHEREMRSKGIPVAGVGAIYPFADDDVTCAPFEIPGHWKVIASLDFGVSGLKDPSIILYIALNPEDGVHYVFSEWGSNMENKTYANSHLPHYIAAKITGKAPENWERLTDNAEFQGMPVELPSIVVKAPHDGANAQPDAHSGSNLPRVEIMTKLGANMHHRLFEIPPDLAPLEKNRRSLHGSLGIVTEMFRLGKLKIFTTCTETLRERRGYQWIKKGQKTVPIDKDNHYMDALRIGVIRVRDDGDTMTAARQPAVIQDEYSNSFELSLGIGGFNQ